MLHYTVFARPCKAIPPISRQDRALLFPVGWGKMRKTAKIRAPVPEREEGGINEGGDAGMEPVRVWTKQHAGVAEELARAGVYRAKGRYIALDLKEHAPLVLEVYDWLVAHTPAAPHRPEGAEYPVWVSFLREGTMLPGEGAVILELELDPELITRINVAKWGAMLNYAYLPRDEADARRHRKLLSDYGASDAFMTSFYPQIKREILDSWQRLFRHHAALGMGDRSGVGGVQAGLWCIRREWVAAVR